MKFQLLNRNRFKMIIDLYIEIENEDRIIQKFPIIIKIYYKTRNMMIIRKLEGENISKYDIIMIFGNYHIYWGNWNKK